jgi:hypothetical protein
MPNHAIASPPPLLFHRCARCGIDVTPTPVWGARCRDCRDTDRPTTCTHPGCADPIHGRRLCTRHYQAARKKRLRAAAKAAA